jgi:hypothetical protein
LTWGRDLVRGRAVRSRVSWIAMSWGRHRCAVRHWWGHCDRRVRPLVRRALPVVMGLVPVLVVLVVRVPVLVLHVVVALRVVVPIWRARLLRRSAAQDAFQNLVSEERNDSSLHNPAFLHRPAAPPSARFLLLLFREVVRIHESFEVLWSADLCNFIIEGASHDG